MERDEGKSREALVKIFNLWGDRIPVCAYCKTSIYGASIYHVPPFTRPCPIHLKGQVNRGFTVYNSGQSMESMFYEKTNGIPAQEYLLRILHKLLSILSGRK